MFPRFDQPHLTVPIADALNGAKLAIPPQPDLPHFANPAPLRVGDQIRSQSAEIHDAQANPSFVEAGVHSNNSPSVRPSDQNNARPPIETDDQGSHQPSGGVDGRGGEASSDHAMAPGHEPLREIVHPAIMTLDAYHKARWPSATGVCLCRSSVLDALGVAVDQLPDGFGLAIFDAWRPLALQRELYQATLDDPAIPGWLVAEPSDDPALPPPHLSGGAIDLTLTVGSQPVELGTLFDDATERAFAGALEKEPGPERDGRRLLYWAMRGAGFVVYADEWWHFELGTGRWAAITGREARFGAIEPAATLDGSDA